MWYDFKNILFTSGLMFSIRTSDEKLKIFFLYRINSITLSKFFVCLHKFDYIAAIVACVSDVAHWHLFWGGFTLYFLMNSVSIKPPVLFFSSCSFCIFETNFRSYKFSTSYIIAMIIFCRLFFVFNIYYFDKWVF